MRTKRMLLGALLAIFAMLTPGVAMAEQKPPRPADAPPIPADDAGEEAEPRIVGGTQAPAGTWPSHAALLDGYEYDTYYAQNCAGTVIDPSWILTAAHCVTDGWGDPLWWGDVDVLTGTQILDGSGARSWSEEFRILPGYDSDIYDRDLALIRLKDPTTAPVHALPTQGQGVTSGTQVVTAGWGNTGSGYPTHLRQVTLNALTNAACRNTGINPITDDMLCAGISPYNTKDSCQGDSGGPLVATSSGKKILVGIVSWGRGCANGYPGVYTRVANFRNWIDKQIRYGPHPDVTTFVNRTWRGLYGKVPTAAQRNQAISALSSQNNAAWISSRIRHSTFDGRTGAAIRLYRAYFLRDPDTEGLRFWAAQMNNGRGRPSASEFFARSTEFKNRYGSLTNSQFVELVYQNVLGRAPDAEGRAYWVAALNSRRRSRGSVMVGFSESGEYKNKTRARVDVIATYLVLMNRAPTAANMTTWSGRPNVEHIRALLDSPTYHNRY